jgi:hypothetical protein
VICRMTTSTHKGAPRDTHFLYSSNRFNDATSRAKELKTLKAPSYGVA